MKKILISPTEIEVCWQTDDACMVKLKSGKVWICNKKTNNENTFDYISKNKNNSILEINLIEYNSVKKGGKYGK